MTVNMFCKGSLRIGSNWKWRVPIPKDLSSITFQVVSFYSRILVLNLAIELLIDLVLRKPFFRDNSKGRLKVPEQIYMLNTSILDHSRIMLSNINNSQESIETTFHYLTCMFSIIFHEVSTTICAWKQKLESL